MKVGASYPRNWLRAPHDEGSAEFTVLSACRICRHALDGSHVSKTDAAAWALERDPTLSAIGTALARRAGANERFDPDHVKAVIRRGLDATPLT